VTHTFDVNNKSKLDNPKRREMLPVNQVLVEIGLRAGDTFADIGCGIGYFTISAAEVVGEKGMIYAMDVQPEMLEVLKQKVKESELTNIRTILTEDNDFKLEESVISYAFICTVLHEVDDKVGFIKEVVRILDDSGRIAVVEWRKSESDWGPPVNHRMDHCEVEQLLLEAGFMNHSLVILNEHFYIVMATK
jgi:ubiquinone/menaquinone biosynthesis C-methylase UbiE